MFWVGICGSIGFFVFDMYRIQLVKEEKGYLELYTDGVWGIFAKIGVYFAAFFVSVFASIDVLLSIESSSIFRIESDLVGSYIRGFTIGLAGPAGISKYNTDAGMPTQKEQSCVEGSADSLDPIAIGVWKSISFALKRQFLR